MHLPPGQGSETLQEGAQAHGDDWVRGGANPFRSAWGLILEASGYALTLEGSWLWAVGKTQEQQKSKTNTKTSLGHMPHSSLKFESSILNSHRNDWYLKYFTVNWNLRVSCPHAPLPWGHTGLTFELIFRIYEVNCISAVCLYRDNDGLSASNQLLDVCAFWFSITGDCRNRKRQIASKITWKEKEVKNVNEVWIWAVPVHSGGRPCILKGILQAHPTASVTVASGTHGRRRMSSCWGDMDGLCWHPWWGAGPSQGSEVCSGQSPRTEGKAGTTTRPRTLNCFSEIYPIKETLRSYFTGRHMWSWFRK